MSGWCTGVCGAYQCKHDCFKEAGHPGACDCGSDVPGHGTLVDVNRWAQIAYSAYGATTNYKNYAGLPMPLWADLTLTIQDAWRSAAKAAREA